MLSFCFWEVYLIIIMFNFCLNRELTWCYVRVCIVSHRLLYWTENQSDGKGRLMECRLDGSGVRTVLGRQRQGQRRSRSVSTQASSSCSCPDFSVALSFAIDYTQPVSQVQVFVADSDTGNIWSTDTAGCQCQLIVNATTLSLTPSDIGQCTFLIFL